MENIQEKIINTIVKNKKTIWFLLTISTLIFIIGSFHFIKKLRPELDYLLAKDHPLNIDTKIFNSRYTNSDNTLISIKCIQDCTADLKKLTQLINDKHELNIVIAKSNFSEEVNFFKNFSLFYYPINQFETLDQKIFGSKNNVSETRNLSNNLINLVTYKRTQIFKILDSLPGGDLVSKDKKSAMIILIHEGQFNDLAKAKNFKNNLDNLLQDYKKEHSEIIDFQINGFAHTLIQEYESLWGDMIFSTILVVIILLFIVYYFFKSFKISFLLFLPVCFGIIGLYSFGSILFNEINSNAFFLSALIAGNSVNVGIILFANFKIFSTDNIEKSIALTIKNSLRPTILSTMLTSIVYLVLIFIPFKGYSDFGILGASGMIFCFISYYLFFILFISSHLITPKDFTTTKNMKLPDINLKNATKKIVFISVLMLGFIYLNKGFKKENIFEPNMNKIKDRNYASTSFNNFKNSINNIAINTSLLPTGIILFNNQSDALKFKKIIDNDDKLRRITPELSIYGIDDIVATDINKKQFFIDKFNKLKNINEIKLHPSITKNEEDILDLAARFNHEFDSNQMHLKIPSFLKILFTEKNGTFGNILFLNYDLNKLEENLFNMNTFFDRIDFLKVNIHPKESVIYVGLIPMLSTIGKNILDNFWLPIVLSIIAIIISIVLILPKSIDKKTFLISYLFIFISFIFFMHLFSFKLHVLNYISLLLTMGIGIDYLVNISLSDYKDELAPFVLLCSLTTMLSYLALYFGTTHLGLKSFALMSSLGELLSIAISVLLSKTIAGKKNRH